MLLLLLLLAFMSLAIQERCFERYRNHTLIGSVLFTINDVTLLQCQKACLEVKRQSCRSFMYHTSKSRCYINSEDKDTLGSSLFPVLDTVDYYHRECYRPTGMEFKNNRQKDSVFDDKCFEIIEGKVLIGVVDQLIKDVTTLEQCKKRCQKSKEASDIICKSAIYYKKDKCIIASQSRNDIPDLFVDDSQATYMENTCLKNNTADTKEIQEPLLTQTMSDLNYGDSVKPTDASNQTTTIAKNVDASMKASLTPVGSSTLAESLYKPGKDPVSNVELSGYEAVTETVSDKLGITDIIGADADSNITVQSTTDELTTTIDVRVIDTYNVDVAVKTSAEASFGKRLRDSRVKDCFTEVRPLRPMEQTRITKAYSLEQCADICRLCWRCLQGKKCLGVAFDISREQCALSSSQIAGGGVVHDLDPIIYHNRNDC